VTGGRWALLLLLVLVVVLMMGQGSSPASSTAPAWWSSLPPVPPPPAPASSGGSSSIASRCKEVFAYNDPSRYVGHADQRVQAVSTANTALSTINCGAVGVVETGVKKVGSFLGGLF
jgi:hypothetical protein